MHSIEECKTERITQIKSVRDEDNFWVHWLDLSADQAAVSASPAKYGNTKGLAMPQKCASRKPVLTLPRQRALIFNLILVEPVLHTISKHQGLASSCAELMTLHLIHRNEKVPFPDEPDLTTSSDHVQLRKFSKLHR